MPDPTNGHYVVSVKATIEQIDAALKESAPLVQRLTDDLELLSQRLHELRRGIFDLKYVRDGLTMLQSMTKIT